MLTSRLTTTLRSASRLAPVERLIVTIAGSSCGVRPTAIARAKSSRFQQRAADHDVDHEDRAGEHGGDADEQQREVAQAELERGLRLALSEPQGDRAELRPTAGAHDDAQPAAFAHDRAHERARREVQRGLRRRDRIAALLRRQGLAGEHRLVAFQAVGVQQAQVRRHDVADGQPHDVARHELGDVDRHRLAVAHRERRVAQLGVQRLDGQLGAVLVEEPQPDAQADDQQDDQRRWCARRRQTRSAPRPRAGSAAGCAAGASAPRTGARRGCATRWRRPRASRARASSADRPSTVLCRRASTSSAGSAAADTSVSDLQSTAFDGSRASIEGGHRPIVAPTACSASSASHHVKVGRTRAGAMPTCSRCVPTYAAWVSLRIRAPRHGRVVACSSWGPSQM